MSGHTVSFFLKKEKVLSTEENIPNVPNVLRVKMKLLKIMVARI